MALLTRWKWYLLAGALLIAAALAAYLSIRARWIEEGRRRVADEIDRRGRETERRMRDADKPRNDDETRDRLDSGRF